VSARLIKQGSPLSGSKADFGAFNPAFTQGAQPENCWLVMVAEFLVSLSLRRQDTRCLWECCQFERLAYYLDFLFFCIRIALRKLEEVDFIAQLKEMASFGCRVSQMPSIKLKLYKSSLICGMQKIYARITLKASKFLCTF
jgi:hypothetical protein